MNRSAQHLKIFSNYYRNYQHMQSPDYISGFSINGKFLKAFSFYGYRFVRHQEMSIESLLCSDCSLYNVGIRYTYTHIVAFIRISNNAGNEFLKSKSFFQYYFKRFRWVHELFGWIGSCAELNTRRRLNGKPVQDGSGE